MSDTGPAGDEGTVGAAPGAIAIADLASYYSALTTVDVRELSVWAALCNRAWEAELQGRNKVVIQDPTYNTDPATRVRGADYTNTKAESSSDQIVLQVNHRSEQRNVLDYEDAEEAPIDWLTRIRASQAIDMATGGDNSVNSTVFTDMTTGGAAFAASQKATLGKAATDYISRTAPYDTKGKGYELVHKAVEIWDLYLQRQNMRGATIGGTVGEPCMVMHPELFVGYRGWLAAQGYQWDRLSESVLGQGSVLTGDRFMGEIFGLKFVTSNRYAVPADEAAWTFNAFTTSAWAFAMKSPLVQILDPVENQTAPEWDMKQIGRWATKEINKGFKFEFKILSE